MDQLYYDSIDLLKALIATDRVSRHESAAADLVRDFMRDHGLKPTRLFDNVIATIGEYVPTRPSLLLNSHLDTVPAGPGWTRDPHTPDVEGDRLYGLGSNDAGGSLVSLLAVACHLRAHPELHPDYNIIFVASAMEEISGEQGIRAVIPTLPPVDVAIVGEPTAMNPAITERGLMVLDVTVTGEAAHAASGLGVNAIYRAMDYISTLRDLSFGAPSPTLGPVRVTVAQITGGVKHNVVPDRCQMVIDVRTTDTCSNLEALDILSRDMPDYVTLKPRSTRLMPSAIDENHPLVRRLVTLGRTPYGSPTLSDRALMPWPSFKIGPGDSARSHTPDEFITLSSIREAQALLLSLLTRVFG